jgi:DNA-binding CsgD family transcriptional regulator
VRYLWSKQRTGSETVNVAPFSSASPFVGRAAELAVLTARLQAAIDGRGSVALIAGEPGIGKTRLAEELAGLAEQRGVRVVWGRCYEGEGAPSFWPWLQALRACLRDDERAPLREQVGDDAIARLAPILPELGGAAERTPAAQDLPPDQARFQLFLAIGALLRTLSAREPLLIVIEDLHWADVASLLLLEFLVHDVGTLRLLLVATYRNVDAGRGHPLSATLGLVARDPRGVRVALGGLDFDDVARLVGADGVARSDDGRELARLIHRETEGNPLFVTELVRLLRLEGRLDAAARFGGGLGVPQTVREVIARRLDALSAVAVEALGVAAVLGQEFDVPLLAGVMDCGVAEALARLEEAEAARIISPGAERPGRYAFTHALVHEALYSGIPASRRGRLHLGAAETIESRYAADLETHLTALAYHFAQAGPLDERGRASSYAERAAHRAMQQLAYEEAAGFFELALSSLDLQPPADPLRRCTLLVELGSAHASAGERGVANDVFRRAVTAARRLEDREAAARLLARAVLGIAGPPLFGLWPEPELPPLLEEALAALSEPELVLRARLLTRRVVACFPPQAVADRLAAIEDAVAVARLANDRSVLAAALLVQRFLLVRPEQMPVRQAVADEIVRLADGGTDRELLLRGLEARLLDAFELGDLSAFDASLSAIGALAETLRHPYYRRNVLMWRSSRAVLAGALDEADELAGEAFALGKQVGLADAELQRGFPRLISEWEGDRHAATVPRVRAAAAANPTQRAYRGILLWFLADLATMDGGAAGSRDDAAQELQQLAARAFDDLPFDQTRLSALFHLGAACVALGDAPRAALIYDLLQPYTGLLAVAPLAATVFGLVDSTLGRIAALLGRWQQAETHLAAALALAERVAAPLWLADAEIASAELLFAQHQRRCRGAGDCGHPARAEALLTPALAAARERGATRLVRIASAARTAWPPDAAPTTAPAKELPAGLSRREAEVLALLAEGRSNKEIAAALVLSPATVHQHLINVYQKIGAHSRAQAAAFAFRHALAVPAAGEDDIGAAR